MDTSTKQGNGHDHGDKQAKSDIAASANHIADDAEQAASAAAGQLRDAYQRFAESGRACVRASPATSVLIAVVAGIGLSRLLFPRR